MENNNKTQNETTNETNNEQTVEKKNIFEDVKDDTELFDKKDIESGKVMAILAYIGILCLIPYFAEKNNKFVVYHAKQGLNLFIIEIIATAAVSMLSIVLFFLFFVGGLIGLAVSAGSFALSIIGIVNVCNGKAKELPIINKFKIIK